MRGTLASLIIVVLILAAVLLKMSFGSNPLASSETVSTSPSHGISAYELHRNHPRINDLPKQDAPPP